MKWPFVRRSRYELQVKVVKELSLICSYYDSDIRNMNEELKQWKHERDPKTGRFKKRVE